MALLAVGVLTGSMFGPTVADAARRVIADDLACATPCVQDSEISGVAASKINGKVGEADTLDGLDSSAFASVIYSGDHELDLELPYYDDHCRRRSITLPVTLLPTDQILVQPADGQWAYASATHAVDGTVHVFVCIGDHDSHYAGGTYRFTVLR